MEPQWLIRLSDDQLGTLNGQLGIPDDQLGTSNGHLGTPNDHLGMLIINVVMLIRPNPQKIQEMQ